MANKLYNETSIQDIAMAIREKNGLEDKYNVSQMGDAIRALSGGGILPTGTLDIDITENGTTNYDVTNYERVSVTVNIESGNSGSGDSNNGNSIKIGNMDNSPNLINLFYGLENGIAKTGEICLEKALPNTETLLLSTGLEKVNMIVIFDTEYTELVVSDTPENLLYTMSAFDDNGEFLYGAGIYTIYNSASNLSNKAFSGFIPRLSSYRWDGGDLYVVASYNANINYTPFYPNKKYRWVAL